MARARRVLPTIEYEWANEEEVIHRLISLSVALDDFLRPLEAAQYIAIEDSKKRFATGTDPQGRPWDEWSDLYEPWALEHTTGPILPGRANLHLTGAMYEEMINPSNYQITPDSLFLDTSSFPPYWEWNNFGRMRINALGGDTQAQTKEFHRATRRREREMFGGVKGFKATALGKLPGENLLPERQFVGLSVVAQAKINTMFSRWFAGTVQFYTTASGKIGQRHVARGAGGRFVKAT